MRYPVLCCLLGLLAACGDAAPGAVEAAQESSHPLHVVGGSHQDRGTIGITGTKLAFTVRNTAATDFTVERVRSSCGCAALNLEKGQRLGAHSEQTFHAMVAVQPSQSRTLFFAVELKEHAEPLQFTMAIRGADFGRYRWQRSRFLGKLPLHRTRRVRLAMTVPPEDRHDLRSVETRWSIGNERAVRLRESGVDEAAGQFFAVVELEPQFVARQHSKVYLYIGDIRFPFHLAWRGAQSPLASRDIVTLRPAGADSPHVGTFRVAAARDQRPVCVAAHDSVTCEPEWQGTEWTVRVRATPAWVARDGTCRITVRAGGQTAVVRAVATL